MNATRRLHDLGQSLWLDNISRGLLASGTLARYIEMAMHGAKSAYPSMLPANAFLKDLEVMLRTLVAGAVAVPSAQRSGKSVPAKTPKRKTIGKSLPKSLTKSLAKSLARKPGGRR